MPTKHCCPDRRVSVMGTAEIVSDPTSWVRSVERVNVYAAVEMHAGFDTPVRFLPSIVSQQARQQALPPPAELAQRLRAATAELPIRPERLRPFLEDVEAARNAAALKRADLDGTSLALATDALLVQRGGRWSALLPLKAAQLGAGEPAIDPRPIRAALAQGSPTSAVLVDLLHP